MTTRETLLAQADDLDRAMVDENGNDLLVPRRANMIAKVADELRAQAATLPTEPDGWAVVDELGTIDIVGLTKEMANEHITHALSLGIVEARVWKVRPIHFCDDQRGGNSEGGHQSKTDSQESPTAEWEVAPPIDRDEVVAALRESGAVAWWNGIRKPDERDESIGPSFSREENSAHDIPLFAGFNPHSDVVAAFKVAAKWALWWLEGHYPADPSTGKADAALIRAALAKVGE